MRRSFGTTLTASVSVISTSAAPEIAFYTDRASPFRAPVAIASFNNSFVSSPNGDGLILDLAYTPFSYGPFPYPKWNVKLGPQFTEYLHRFGERTISTVRFADALIARRATTQFSHTPGSRFDVEGQRPYRGSGPNQAPPSAG
jgi:hypothetical protein